MTYNQIEKLLNEVYTITANPEWSFNPEAKAIVTNNLTLLKAEAESGKFKGDELISITRLTDNFDNYIA